MNGSSDPVVGLLSLPEGVLLHVLSFLCPLSLAAVCLVCRALRKAATSDRKRVKLSLDSWYCATANASPRVLRTMHSIHSLLERLDEEQKAMDADCRIVPDRPWYHHTHRWLHFQLLASVAGEVVFLKVREQWHKMKPASDELLHTPQHLLAQMPLLESLWLRAEEDAGGRTIIHELPALRHLNRLKLSKAPHKLGIQLICSTLALTELDFGSVEPADRGAAEDYCSRLMLDRLAHGKTSGLQTLVLSLPAKDVSDLSMLTGLSSLTNLRVKTWDPPCDLAGLASLTGLESLRVSLVEDYDLDDLADDALGHAIAATLSPLSALTRLSVLHVVDNLCQVGFRSVPPDVSVLSCLTALRVLRCSAFDEAEVFPGDPLPVQLRFLRSATALEELDLRFWGSFWSLPDASSCAVRAAVAALTSLTRVKIEVETPFRSALSDYYAPLAAFASAASIESLSYATEDPLDQIPSLQTIAQARGCLTALTKLQALRISCTDDEGDTPDCAEYGIIPDVAGLLAGVPSTRLARLDLSVDSASAELMAQIARFRHLQGLTLLCSSASMRFLDPLFELKCLTGLHLSLDAKAIRAQHGRAISTIKADVARLKSAIIDTSHLVGRRAQVDIEMW